MPRPTIPAANARLASISRDVPSRTPSPESDSTCASMGDPKDTGDQVNTVRRLSDRPRTKSARLLDSEASEEFIADLRRSRNKTALNLGAPKAKKTSKSSIVAQANHLKTSVPRAAAGTRVSNPSQNGTSTTEKRSHRGRSAPPARRDSLLYDPSFGQSEAPSSSLSSTPGSSEQHSLTLAPSSSIARHGQPMEPSRSTEGLHSWREIDGVDGRCIIRAENIGGGLSVTRYATGESGMNNDTEKQAGLPCVLPNGRCDPDADWTHGPRTRHVTGMPPELDRPIPGRRVSSRLIESNAQRPDERPPPTRERGRYFVRIHPPKRKLTLKLRGPALKRVLQNQLASLSLDDDAGTISVQ